jgi:predicted kinase
MDDVGRRAKLIFFCGKMAAGKSTLAAELTRSEDAILIVQDDLLVTLFPGEIVDIPAFVDRSARVRAAMEPVIRSLLSRGVSVVLDFPGNTKSQRAWFKQLLAGVDAEHQLHFIDASDAVCKAQLARRSASLPAGSAWTTEAEFDAITRYFQPPADDEGFNVVRHARG